jgi:hypothetical protein
LEQELALLLRPPHQPNQLLRLLQLQWLSLL